MSGMILGRGPQGPQGVPGPAGPNTSNYAFGGPASATVGGGSKFLTVGYHPPTNAGLLATDPKYVTVKAGTADLFIVNVLDSSIGAGNVTLRIYKNGVATAMQTAPIANGATGPIVIVANSFEIGRAHV